MSKEIALCSRGRAVSVFLLRGIELTMYQLYCSHELFSVVTEVRFLSLAVVPLCSNVAEPGSPT